MRHVLIIGATSAIAEATARHFAQDGDRLYLVARNQERLSDVSADLRIRGASQVETQVMDANDTAHHLDMIARAKNAMGALDTILIAHGTLSDQKNCEASYESTLSELQTNCLSVISILTHVANLFETQQHGTIAVISSVAGERGRQSNYIYGTAKSAVSTYLQGLRNRLHRAHVNVITVKPGFVDTPMTAGFRKNKLWAKPDRVANDIYRAIKKKKEVIYTPPFWRGVMFMVRAIPESYFKRLRL